MDAASLVREASEKLREAGVDTPILEAEVMLSHATNRTRTEIVTHPELIPDFAQTELFREWVERRARREPLAYIIRERDFYGMSFEVVTGLLVPRQETETLVDTALEILRRIPEPIVCDVGLGTGALAVALAANLPESQVYGTDTSAVAVEISHRNALRQGVDGRTRFFQGDLFAPLPTARFHMVVSNPPYIPTGEIDSLQPEVSRYEPREALDGGPDGLDFYRRLAAETPERLRPGGHLAVEVGVREAGPAEEIFAEHGFTDIRTVRDLSGIERVVLGCRP
ncbi:MAG: peptide chain release factor N(5)-glutamine methyltransferase [Armatimonadota bacterium]